MDGVKKITFCMSVNRDIDMGETGMGRGTGKSRGTDRAETGMAANRDTGMSRGTNEPRQAWAGALTRPKQARAPTRLRTGTVRHEAGEG